MGAKCRPLLIFLNCLRLFMEALSQIIFGILYWNYKSEKLPPIKNLLLIESATSIALKIRNRKITSEEVTRAYIERIKIINPLINAVVDTRFDEAIAEARKADEFLRVKPDVSESLEKEKPFFGVPTTIKECFQVTGLHQTGGIYARKDNVASSDADIVKLLREAGAIVMCATNVPEACMWWETYNNIYGRTCNPYDFGRAVGGSSGGEAANLSACGSPMGVGSDIGGSIRMPAYMNGVFGHKPSSGIVSNLGQVPDAVGVIDTFLSTGPICRYACDLKSMLKVLAASNANLLSLDKQVNMRKLKIYYMEGDTGNVIVTPVNKELRRAMIRTVEYFRTTYNVHCQKLKLKQFKKSPEIFFGKMSSEPLSSTFCSIMTNYQGDITMWKEFVKLFFGTSKYTVPGLMFGTLEKMNVGGRNLHRFDRAFRALDDLKHILLDLLDENAVFLYPPHPTEPPHHYQSLFRPCNFTYTSTFNMLGFPVTECPLGLNSNGLPLGIQVVAGPNLDRVCLAVAEDLEKAFGGWVCPSEIQ